VTTIITRDSIYAIARIYYMLSPVRLSVRPSVTRVDHRKTVEVRIYYEIFYIW